MIPVVVSGYQKIRGAIRPSQALMPKRTHSRWARWKIFSLLVGGYLLVFVSALVCWTGKGQALNQAY